MPNINKLGTTGKEVAGALTVENAVFYDKNLLKRLVENLVWAKWAQKRTAPKRSGDTISYRRFESLEPTDTPLEEGVTPEGRSLVVNEIKSVVEQYGEYIEITDRIDMLGIDPVLTEASDILGEMAGALVDNKCRDALTAGTNVVYANGKTTRASVSAADKLTGAVIKKAVTVLKKANVKRINGYYIGIIDPDCASDLMDDPLWQDVSKYNGGVQIMKGEIGKIHGVRFFETSNAKVFEGAGESGANVHSTVILGADAYGIPDIEGSATPKMIVKDFGSAGTADPLNQRATAGYKLLFDTIRLQELAIVRIESGVTE